jgi:surface antigen
MGVLEVRRTRRTFRIFYLLLLLYLLLVCSAAQGFVLWSDALPPLTKSDMEIINKLTEGLELQEPGTTWRWENPENGHSGRITLIKAFQTEGMSCRILKHHVVAGTDEPWVTEFTTCRNAEGHWVLRPDIKPPAPGKNEEVQ